MILEILFILFFGFGDYYTTKLAIGTGRCREGNLLPKYIIERCGFSGIAVSKIIIILAFLFLSNTSSYYILIIPTIMSIGVVIWNIKIINEVNHE